MTISLPQRCMREWERSEHQLARKGPVAATMHRSSDWPGRDPVSVCGLLLEGMNYEQAIKDLQDTLIVISEIERRQSALLREHSEYLGELLEFRLRTEKSMASLTVKMEELTGKLNGLIGYMDGLRPPSPPGLRLQLDGHAVSSPSPGCEAGVWPCLHRPRTTVSSYAAVRE